MDTALEKAVGYNDTEFQLSASELTSVKCLAEVHQSVETVHSILAPYTSAAKRKYAHAPRQFLGSAAMVEKVSVRAQDISKVRQLVSGIKKSTAALAYQNGGDRVALFIASGSFDHAKMKNKKPRGQQKAVKVVLDTSSESISFLTSDSSGVSDSSESSASWGERPRRKR